MQSPDSRDQGRDCHTTARVMRPYRGDCAGSTGTRSSPDSTPACPLPDRPAGQIPTVNGCTEMRRTSRGVNPHSSPIKRNLWPHSLGGAISIGVSSSSVPSGSIRTPRRSPMPSRRLTMSAMSPADEQARPSSATTPGTSVISSRSHAVRRTCGSH